MWTKSCIVLSSVYTHLLGHKILMLLVICLFLNLLTVFISHLVSEKYTAVYS